MIKNLIYSFLLFLLPKKIINVLGSSETTSSIRDWLFDREKVLKPKDLIKWNNLNFYFRAPLQILNKARTNGIENSLTRSIIKLINIESNVIDIGANYGFLTLVCSKYVINGGGKVYSFECDENCIKNLEFSIIENNLKNIELYNQFVGSENNNTTKTVDSLIYDHCKKIDLIKIDTDGTDLNCLKGCDKILKAFKPIIVIEINDNLEQIIKFLIKIGYKFFYDQYLKEIDHTKKNIIPNLFSSNYQL